MGNEKLIKMKISVNFEKSEFDSHDGGVMPVDVFLNVVKLANQLQRVRDELNRTVKVNSGYRSPEHNKKIGGVPDSQHVFGRAADIVVDGVSPKKVFETIETLISRGDMLQGGLGLYDNFVHYDIRGIRSRWDFRKKKAA